jgi:hypothetical protein
MFQLHKLWFRPRRRQWRLSWVLSQLHKVQLVSQNLGRHILKDRLNKHLLHCLQFDLQGMLSEQQYRQHKHFL